MWGSMDTRTELFEWEDQSLIVKLVNDGSRKILEVALESDRVSRQHEHSVTDPGKLSCAASILLSLDANRARVVKQGKVARINVTEPHAHQPYRLSNAKQALALRPTVQDLIAPLLFDRIPQSKLRPFQVTGVRWLLDRRVGILADDMGLGKTAQALIAAEHLITQGNIRSTVVICPKSLLANWEVECGRWVPGLTVLRVMPRKDQSNEVWSAILGRSHVIITSYDQLRSIPTPLRATRLDLVIADEAHRLRRSQAKLVKSFRLMATERLWALTGTPIERHEVDLATLLSLLEPTKFSAQAANIGQTDLRAQARPYILRRMKRDVLSELPRVIDTKEMLELTPKQKQTYTSVMSKPLTMDVSDVLKRFTILRSICDVDPRTGSSSKLDRIIEILHSVREADEKAVVFSYLLQPLEILETRLKRIGSKLQAVVLTGKLTARDREHVLRKFRNDSDVVALLCSSRVGGEGLTLTEANHVLFINEWWNPSANSQARDRVVRLGQERIVHIHRFRCEGTLEEALEQILKRKSEAFTNILDALVIGETPGTSRHLELLGNEIRGELLKHGTI